MLSPSLYTAAGLLFAVRHADLLKGIYDMGFTKPSKIQESALPLLLGDP